MSSESARLPLQFTASATEDREAAALYNALRNPLLHYLVCLGLSRDEAQDVVQDAFVRLHHHIEAGGSQENIRAWLFRVAHNAARNFLTRYDRRFAAPLVEGLEAVCDDASPERAILNREKFRKLADGVRELTDIERDCLLLRARGLRYREIAEVLALATSTVAGTVERAVRKLAEKCNV